MRLTLIVHERRGRWARRLRPLVAGWGARLVESRSADDLTSAIATAACPIVVLDLGERLRPGLDDLSRAASSRLECPDPGSRRHKDLGVRLARPRAGGHPGPAGGDPAPPRHCDPRPMAAARPGAIRGRRLGRGSPAPSPSPGRNSSTRRSARDNPQFEASATPSPTPPGASFKRGPDPDVRQEDDDPDREGRA